VGQAPAWAAAAVSGGGDSLAGDVDSAVGLDPHALMLAVKTMADRPMTLRRMYMQITLVQMKIISNKDHNPAR
jgi:hypothetical protein